MSQNEWNEIRGYLKSDHLVNKTYLLKNMVSNIDHLNQLF